MVAKFSPTRFGKRKSSRPLSQVPSPTCKVLDEYELLPGGASCGEGDMAKAARAVQAHEALSCPKATLCAGVQGLHHARPLSKLEAVPLLLIMFRES